MLFAYHDLEYGQYRIGEVTINRKVIGTSENDQGAVVVERRFIQNEDIDTVRIEAHLVARIS